MQSFLIFTSRSVACQTMAADVATFNSYASQSGTVCGSKTAGSGRYGAALGDLSPLWSGGKCSGSVDTSKCNGQNPVSGYTAPSCPKDTCGKCYKVCNQGGYNGASVGGVGNCITAEIIDACPSESAQNYCKTDVPANGRCGASGVNQIDIDQSAYQPLTGKAWGSSNVNLEVSITSTGC